MSDTTQDKTIMELIHEQYPDVEYDPMTTRGMAIETWARGEALDNDTDAMIVQAVFGLEETPAVKEGMTDLSGLDILMGQQGIEHPEVEEAFEPANGDGDTDDD